MKIIIPFLSIFFLISSCKKSSTIPEGNPNNEVKAMVAVKSTSFAPFSAIGNYTIFAKRTDSNSDKVITIYGSHSQRSIAITLVNINSVGIYTIGNGGAAGAQYVLGAFEIGNLFSGSVPWEYFTVPLSTPPSGNITIDELTSTSIRGSFAMDCTGTTGSIQITNGTFKGTF